MKKVPEEIANELWKALNKLEVSTDIIKAVVGYLDIPEEELTEGERCLLRRSKEFLGEK
jgi:hypothetical protein|tara:strand:+ start:299 stop:475 length:177 start_codon:yes stop_codon:yes gene_type:complete